MLQIVASLSDIDLLQGSAVTRLKCGGIILMTILLHIY